MLHKLRQMTNRYKLTSSHRLPMRRARHFITNELRLVREERPSGPLRAAIGLIR